MEENSPKENRGADTKRKGKNRNGRCPLKGLACQVPDATAGICLSPGSILPTSWRERSGADGEAKTLPPPLPSSSLSCVCPATMTASRGAIWQPWCSCDLLCAWLCHLGMSELLRGRFSSFPRAKTPLGHLPANHVSRFQCVHPFLHSALVTVALVGVCPGAATSCQPCPGVS